LCEPFVKHILSNTFCILFFKPFVKYSCQIHFVFYVVKPFVKNILSNRLNNMYLFFFSTVSHHLSNTFSPIHLYFILSNRLSNTICIDFCQTILSNTALFCCHHLSNFILPNQSSNTCQIHIVFYFVKAFCQTICILYSVKSFVKYTLYFILSNYILFFIFCQTIRPTSYQNKFCFARCYALKLHLSIWA